MRAEAIVATMAEAFKDAVAIETDITELKVDGALEDQMRRQPVPERDFWPSR